MGIWIRTKDKSNLLELNGFSIYEDNGDIEVRGFQTSDDDDVTWILGCYSTEEKALKVLDMIQEQINGSDCIGYANESIDSEIHTQSVKVFQMPQDSEV